MLNRFNETNQGHRGHIKVKYELNQGLVIINLYMKLNVHASTVKQVIVLDVADSRTDTPHDDNWHSYQFGRGLKPMKTEIIERKMVI